MEMVRRHRNPVILKGVSDFAGNKQSASAHRTAAQVAVYDRKKQNRR